MSKTPSKLDLSGVGRTNLCHSDEEIQLIDEAVCRTKEALQRVRGEKSAILLREEALQSDLDRYLSARAPIKRLPDNVLCNIFKLTCQDESPVDVPFSRWFIPHQIIISHVCSIWRQLILDTPSFWCSIGLESDMALSTGREMNLANIAHAWLSRAKSLPCSVKIVFTNNSWSDRTSQRNRLTDILTDIISLYRVGKLDITFPDYHLRDLLQLPDDKLRCIEDLCLRHIDLLDTATGESTKPFKLHKLSSLTSFSLSNPLSGIPRLVGMVYEDGSRFASVPWHQLRHIKIHMTFSMLFCLKILELSSAVLETCTLDVHEDSLSPPSSFKEPIHCSQLRELKLDIYLDAHPTPETDDIIDPFLSLLRCPNLKSLTVGSLAQSTAGFILPQSINLQTFLRIQHISGMHLEELVIHNTSRDLEVLPLLASVPSLRRLILPQTIKFTEEAMDELGSGSIAPLLEDLTIKQPVLVLERLLQMIKTRSSGKEDSTRKYKPTPFKSVVLYCNGLGRKEHYDNIEEINRSGVYLNVNWGGCDSNDDLMAFDPWDGLYDDDDYDDEEDDLSDMYEW